jgi:uncharacterized Zn finger protein (UPF0148 family)
MELKYCEHCGGLWVRECGTGVVFCKKCETKVDEFPMRKKRAGRIRLPQGPRSMAEQYTVSEEELRDLDAVGGVA